MTRILDLLPTFDVPFGGSLNRWMAPFTYTVECADWTQAADVGETDKVYIVTMELPGIDKEKLDISYVDGTLRVKGEKVKETEEGECCHCSERYSGGFERTVEIPGKVDKDKIDATYKDGVLKLTLHKSEETKPKKIELH